LSHSLLSGAYDFRHSSGSLAVFAAIRRASSLVSSFAADLRGFILAAGSGAQVIVVAGGTRAALAAKAATNKIPIIFSAGDPSHFEDRYENAVVDLLKKKQAGEKIVPVRGAPPQRVVNLMDALRASVDAEKKKAPAPSTQARRPAKKKVSQK
jgi:hypothetical protein